MCCSGAARDRSFGADCLRPEPGLSIVKTRRRARARLEGHAPSRRAVVGTGQRVLATDLRGVNWMDFSPDGKWLLIASAHAPVTLFEVATGARLPLATLPTSQAVAWRP